MDVRGWMRRRWFALLVAVTTFVLLTQGATSWVTLLGAVVIAHLLYRTCVTFGAGGIFLWPVKRVSVLEHRAVLVTGCDSGFGHATARRLQAAGVGRVFACVLESDSVGAKALRALDPVRMRVIQCDITKDADIAAARATVEEELRAADCELWAVVNNAGILVLGECEWMDLQHVKRIIDVNTLGQVRITQAFLPLLRKSQGRIVNVNSAASRVPVLILTPYVMSKHASLAFTDTLRIDMSKFNVSVHSIEPWIVRTPMAESFLPQLKQVLRTLPEDLKKEYGEGHFKFLMRLVNIVYSLNTSPSSVIEDVVSAIEDACLSSYPEDCYSPGVFAKFMTLLTKWVDIVQLIVVKYISRAFVKE